MFTLKQLNLFISLAHKQKIVEVAREFELTQAAVSMSIKELESILSERLFERVGKRLTLNERGLLFLEQVSVHVDALQKAYIGFMSHKLEGHLRICASNTISDYMLPYLMDKYLSVNKNIKFSLKSANTMDVVRSIKNGEADVGFIEGVYNDETISFKALTTDDLVVVTSDKELSKQGEQYIDALSDRKWILREVGSGTRSVFLDTLHPVTVDVYMELDHVQTIKKFLKLRPNYISCLPRRSVEEELKEGSLFEIKIIGYSFTREFKLIMRKDKQVSALVIDFIDFIEKQQV